jgi:hypothetical protein
MSNIENNIFHNLFFKKCPNEKSCIAKDIYFNKKGRIDFLHFKKYYHYCPYMKSECPNEDIYHGNFLHLCEEDHCPFLEMNPNSTNDIGPYLFHMENYYHICPNHNNNCSIKDIFHKSIYEHHFTMRLKDTNEEKQENTKHCDFCGELCQSVRTSSCHHLICQNCQIENRECFSCKLIHDLTEEKHQNLPEFYLTCSQCLKDTSAYILFQSCEHITCTKCLDKHGECHLCKSEKNREARKKEREIREREKRDYEKAIEESKKIYDEIEIEIHREKKEEDNKEDICSICFEPYSKNEKTTLLCAHYFHTHCIEKWFYTREKEICPLCNSDMEKLKDEQECFFVN